MRLYYSVNSLPFKIDKLEKKNIMKKIRKRPIYRKLSETYYKIYPDNTCIKVDNESLFHVAVISKSKLPNISDNMECCLKREFTKSYRRARKAIRL